MYCWRIILLAGVTPIVCTAQSFDCDKAGSAVEKLICGSPDLSHRDLQLGTVYREALAKSKSPQRLKQEQRQWLTRRDACADEECLLNAYRTRYVELRRLLPRKGEPRPYKGNLSVEGCYERPERGKAGETDTVSVSKTDNDDLSIELHTVYCAYNLSADCMNARFGGMGFSAKLRDNRVLYRGSEGDCDVDISFQNYGLFVYIAGCESAMEYGSPYGRYKKASSEPCGP
jgi:uncharacterized protein